MIIKKIYVDGYKNLSNCEIEPSRLHAITGVNGSGKSNLLEIFQFITTLITGDDTVRDRILLHGKSPSGMQWFPSYVSDTSKQFPFRFQIECEIAVDKELWLVSYSIEIAKPIVQKDRYSLVGQGIISCEEVSIKKLGKPGPAKMILTRNVEGHVTLHAELGVRKKSMFNTKRNMSAIQALEVREADDFVENYPVLNQFKIGLISSTIVKLNFTEMLQISDSEYEHKFYESKIGASVSGFSLHDSIKIIEENEVDWKEYKFWLKTLCNIDKVDAYSPVDSDSKSSMRKLVLITREDQILIPNELSTGNMVLLGLVTALFSFLRGSGVVIFEEPETYIHPKALIDLIDLLRIVSEVKTVLFSTHNPVALNSLNADEVTLMKLSGHGRYTAVPVDEIEEASSAISRGYLSFGDLLQSNFMTDTND